MKRFIAPLILSAFAAPAFAGGYAEPVVETAPVAPVVETPVASDVDWTGWYAGAQWGKGNAETDGLASDIDSDIDGYGLHGGYIRDFGQVAVGGELDYNNVEIDDVSGSGDLWRLRGRVGYAAGKFQPYATLGAAHISHDDADETGITYGIGADYMVTEKFTIGAEYSRNDFSDAVDGPGDTTADLDTDLVQIRGSFRF